MVERAHHLPSHKMRREDMNRMTVGRGRRFGLGRERSRNDTERRKKPDCLRHGGSPSVWREGEIANFAACCQGREAVPAPLPLGPSAPLPLCPSYFGFLTFFPPVVKGSETVS